MQHLMWHTDSFCVGDPVESACIEDFEALKDVKKLSFKNVNYFPLFGTAFRFTHPHLGQYLELLMKYSFQTEF